MKSLPNIDVKQIQQEDIKDEQDGIPPRFGYRRDVDYNLNNSGKWTTLSNGDKIWQLEIYCPGALSINLLYDKFWLPEGAKFFIYSNSREHFIGAFTSVNNKGTKDDLQGFATGLVYGDKITLEYYLPKGLNDQGVISIAHVIHGYRYINIPKTAESGFGSSGNCQVNINCDEGKYWQNEKNAVALILVNGNRYCTGSLINTTENNNTPFFLTADHCLGGWANNNVKYDAISNPTLNHYSFYWHYESPECVNTTNLSYKSTVGAIVVANNSASDFALLHLTEDPNTVSGIMPYYLGWDRSGNAGTGGVGIHHPAGDVKKIATLNSPSTSSGNYWTHYWNQTINGYSVTEGGSSGSPLINNARYVIGQLYGGSNINCSNPSQDIAKYGKFSVSWTGNENSDNRRKLQPWLDPIGTNATTLDGMSVCAVSGTDLMIKDKPEDYGNIGDYPFDWHWDHSPDIWVRNQPDGFINQIGEDPEYSSSNPVYVYVRVWNRSCDVSSAGSGNLAVYWSLASGNSFWPQNWNGTDPDIGDIIEKKTIPNIAPGGSQIIEFKWNISSYILKKDKMGACLIARIEDIPQDPITEHPGQLEYDVYKNNNVAMHNVYFVDLLPDRIPLVGGEVYNAGGYMYVGNASYEAASFDIVFKVPEDENTTTTTITDVAEIRIITDDEGWAILLPVLQENPGIHIVKENEFILANNSVTLENIHFEAEQRILIYVGFSLLSQEVAENEDKTYNFFVGQKYSSSDNHITGAVHFVINCSLGSDEPSDANDTRFIAHAGEDVYADRGETITLNALPVGEEVIYRWYKDGAAAADDFVHEGKEFTTEVFEGKIYYLKITAVSDGFTASDEVEVKLKPSRIENLFPNPTDGHITVMYKINDAEHVQLMITNANYFTFTNIIDLNVNENSITLDMPEYPSGMYIISLICNGQIVSSYTFIKE